MLSLVGKSNSLFCNRLQRLCEIEEESCACALASMGGYNGAGNTDNGPNASATIEGLGWQLGEKTVTGWQLVTAYQGGSWVKKWESGGS